MNFRTTLSLPITHGILVPAADWLIAHSFGNGHIKIVKELTQGIRENL
jgi:hypothetical protein